jgi:chaperonin cofactor prefoldin
MEADEKVPYLIFSIFDEDSTIVRKINSSANAGVNRVVWDLRYESPSPISLKDNKFQPTEKSSSGLLAMPGKYFVSMSLVVRGEEKQLFGPVEFNAIVLNNATLPAENRQEVVEFQKKASQLAKTVMGTQKFAEELVKRNDFIRQALSSYSSAPFELLDRANNVAKDLSEVLFKFNGSQPPASREEIPPADEPLVYRLETLINTQYSSTSNVTKNQQVAYDVLFEEIQPVIEKLKQINDYDLKSIENEMERLDIPWTPGRIPELKK